MGWHEAEDGMEAAQARHVATREPNEGTDRGQGRGRTRGMRARLRSWKRTGAALALVATNAAAPGASATPAWAGGPVAGGPSLTLVGQSPLDGLAGFADLAVHRRTAYVGTEDHEGACRGRGVHVVDVTRPARPTPIGTVAAHPLTVTEDVAVIHAATPAFTGDLLAVGLQACDDSMVEMTGKAGVEFFDVSNPRSPVWLSRVELGVRHLTGVHEPTLFQRGARVCALLAVPFSEVNTGVFTPRTCEETFGSWRSRTLGTRWWWATERRDATATSPSAPRSWPIPRSAWALTSPERIADVVTELLAIPTSFESGSALRIGPDALERITPR